MGQLQLLLHVVVNELILGEKFKKHLEIVPGVEGEKPQLLQQGHCPVLDAAEQIGQVTVVVVVDLQATLEDRAVKGYRSAPAKHVDEAGIPGRRQLSDQPEELALSSHPGNKGPGNTPSPPSREIIQGLLQALNRRIQPGTHFLQISDGGIDFLRGLGIEVTVPVTGNGLALLPQTIDRFPQFCAVEVQSPPQFFSSHTAGPSKAGPFQVG